MDRIWAPWRIQYIQMEKPDGCILCDKPGEEGDDDNYILYRGKLNFVIMNCYPYNPGHLMVAPYRHVAGIDGLENNERVEHFEIVSRAIGVLRQAFNPQGFNVGANMGKVAGAGIDDHMHTHIVPRWQGDTNFMPVLTGVRVVPQALADTYERLRDAFGSLTD